MNVTGGLVGGGGLSIIPVALAVAAGVFFALAALVAIFVVIVVANRADPDPTGRRPLAVYAFGVSFFSIFVVLFGTFAIVLGLVQLMGTHSGVSGASLHPVGDAVTRVVVLGGIIVVIAAVLLSINLRRGLNFPEVAGRQPGPVTRVAQSYAASVSFVCVLIAAASLVVFFYEVFRILAPGVFELSSSRVDAARVLVSALYLAVASAAIVATHARFLPTRGWGPPPQVAGDPGYSAFGSPPPPPF
jgi:hypothetical protein